MSLITRLDAIEKDQASLGAAIERLERRIDDGLGRLTDRIDRLFELSASATRQIPSEFDPDEYEEVAERVAQEITERIRKAREGNP